MRSIQISGAMPLGRIGLGTWQFGAREWGYGEGYAQMEADRIARRALSLGVTLFDTAELYSFGRSERILGSALAGHRDDAFIATKLFPILPLPPIVVARGRASARRLGVRRIDLYQVHQANPVVPDSVIMRGMQRLLDEGVIGEVGVSNYSLARWRGAEQALGRRVLSNQVRYNLVDRGVEQELLPYAADRDRLVIAYSPLAQGFLGAKYDENHRPRDGVRRGNPLFLPENLRAARALFETLRSVAASHDATPAQVALAWLLHQPNVVVIPGASSVEQLEHNVAAAELDLSEDEVAGLREAAEAFRPVTGPAALPRLIANWRTR